MSHLSSGGDSFRPAGINFEGERHNAATRSLEREVGIDLGHQREDAEDFERTCQHEGAHAAAGFALGWDVMWVDARAGQTKIAFPDIQSQTFADRYLQEATIAAAAKAFTGSYAYRDFEDDRYVVLSRGYIDFATAERKAKLIAANPWVQGIYQRLVDALRVHGRLEGDALRAVLDNDE
jgi:hypothetical protein